MKETYITNILETLSTSAVGIITTISAFLLITFKSTYFQESFISFLAKKLHKNIINTTDLKSHEVFIKTRELISNNVFSFEFEDINKQELFNKYMNILGELFCKKYMDLLESDYNKLTELQIKNQIHKILLSIFNELDVELYNYFKSKNIDNSEIITVINKIKNWRNDYQEILLQNVITVFGNYKNFENVYILDKIFTITSISIDFILRDSINSFNKLNGELSKLLHGK